MKKWNTFLEVYNALVNNYVPKKVMKTGRSKPVWWNYKIQKETKIKKDGGKGTKTQKLNSITRNIKEQWTEHGRKLN